MRRDRRATAAPAAEPAATADASRAVDAAGKGPRVFRVAVAQATRPVEAPPVAEAWVEAWSAPALPADGGPPGKTADRTRRIATDRRPGPVLHVVHHLPARPPEQTAEAAAPTVHTLVAGLAHVGQASDAIQGMQSFWIIDEQVSAEWRRLSQLADAIGTELAAQLQLG